MIVRQQSTVQFLLLFPVLSFLKVVATEGNSTDQKTEDVNVSYFESQLINFYFNSTPNSNESLVIPEEDKPVFYDGRFYYWSFENASDGVFLNSKQTSICEYNIQNNDTHLQRVQFANGTAIKSVYFKCDAEKSECCGFTCCPKRHNLSQVAILSFFAFLAFLGWFLSCFCSRGSDTFCSCCSEEDRQECEKLCCNSFTADCCYCIGECCVLTECLGCCSSDCSCP